MLLVALLDDLAETYQRWIGGTGDPAELRDTYLACCATIGRDVDVELPGGEMLSGRARTVDEAGRLVLDTVGGRRAVGAGDVVHVR